MLDIFYEGPNSAMVYLTSPVISFGRLMCGCLVGDVQQLSFHRYCTMAELSPFVAATFGAAANLFLGMSYLTLLEFHVLIGKCIWIFIIRNRY